MQTLILSVLGLGLAVALCSPVSVVTVIVLLTMRSGRRRDDKADERLRQLRHQIVPGRGRKIVARQQRIADCRMVAEPLDHAID